MATYRLHGETVTRAKAHSVVARAAYNARAKLYDERLGQWWDFARKRDLDHREILAPAHAPAWVFDRERLWNAVEASEGRRKNAQTARSFIGSIPVELSQEAGRELVRNFIREEFVARGMVADVAIHESAHNPHFHVLLTLRELDGDGFARTKQRAWNERGLFQDWRVAWQDHANRALAREGHEARVDHRSYADRGIALIPQPKLFRAPRDCSEDRRDIIAERHKLYLATLRENGARIIADPKIALALVATRRSTFTERDLYRALHGHTVDAAQFAEAHARVLACPELVRLGMDDEGRVRFSTRTIVRREQALLQDAHQLAQRSGHRVREANVEQALALAELELSERENKPIKLSAEQVGAVRHVAQGGDLALVQGFAGTGKSTMLYAARLAYEAQGFTVVGGAYTGKAAEGLETGSRIASATLHSWQARWAKGQDRLNSRHVFIIDEAAMVGTEQFGRVIEEVRARGAKLVLVGDTEQIQPIEIGAPMRLLQEQYTPAKLTDVVRQRAHAWQRQATHDFGDRKPDAALQAYLKEGRVHACENAEAAHLAMIEAWARDRAAHPSENSLLLAFRRTDVFTLNQFARDIRKAAGELGQDVTFQTERGKRDFALGDRVLFLRNDRALGVKNGTLGTIERIAHRRLIVRLDDQRTVEVDAKTYNALEHGYASTINKSQSATVDRTYVFASRYMERSKTYVALSRHRQDAHLFFSREEFSATEKLIRCLSRERRDRMAHEVAPHLSADAAVRAALVPADSGFARATAADPGAEMRAVSPTAMLPPLDLHAIIMQLEDVRQLAIAERDAGRDVAQAVRALEAFGGTRTGSREYALQLTELERTQQAHTRARQRLDRATRDPRVVARATRIAQERNARIDRARQRLAELEAYRREVQQANWLRQLARTANEKARRLVFRVAEDRDAALSVRALRTLENGQQLVELGNEQAGVRVLAAPSFCERHGIDLAPRGKPSQPRSRGRGDTDRHH